MKYSYNELRRKERFSMGNFSPIMLFWYIFPVIVMVGTNFLVTTFSLRKRWKIKAPDLAVPLLFIGIHQITMNTYGSSMVPYLVISVLLLGICVAVFQAYYYGELIYGRYLKMFWRLVFLLTMVLYTLVIVMNILHYV